MPEPRELALRVLIARLSALGDCVCSLPVASAIRDRWPEARITWAVDPRFAGIVECCPDVDEVLRVRPGLLPSTWPAFAEPFDLALDLQGLAKSALVVARAKAARKLGYHWQREGAWLASAAVTPDPTSHHIVDQYVDVARAAGATTGASADRAVFRLVPKPEDLDAMRALLAEHGLELPLVLLNAGAGWATKRWPPAHFAALADALAARGVGCALIGGRAEADRAAAGEVVAASARPPADLLGRTSVRELIALVSLAQAHVGGDTGSTHLAAALDVPAIGLYSITRPQRSCPYGGIARCHYDPAGLGGIAPGAVLDSVVAALA